MSRPRPPQVIRNPTFGPESQRLLDQIEQDDSEPDLEALRLDRAQAPDPQLAGSPDPACRTADIMLSLRGGPRQVRLYQAAMEPQPLLLWCHGGGFVGGSVADIEHVCSRLARLAGIKVASLDYRLAPEDPFPAGLHDTYDAMTWLVEHGTLIGGDGQVAAGGQSAGAALVAGACLMARDNGAPTVSRQVLCYPCLDFNQQTESSRRYDGDFLSISADNWANAAYLAGQDITPYAAPLRAATLTELPPALVIGAGRDPLRDDARNYAARLQADSVDTVYVEYAETMHAFLNFCGVLTAGEHAIALIADDLAHTFRGKADNALQTRWT